MKAKKEINIELDFNSNTLIKKLHAITKHTEALANELEEIEKESFEGEPQVTPPTP